MQPFGFTRTAVQRDHAFITPDSHVTGPLPRWEKTRGVVLISPHMGAGFSQYLAHMDAGGRSGAPFARCGTLRLCAGRRSAVAVGRTDDHAHARRLRIPAARHAAVAAPDAPAALNFFERRYVSVPDHAAPARSSGASRTWTRRRFWRSGRHAQDAVARHAQASTWP
ncbi:MAG: hypothetical protein R2838_11595 [Caldilineaceae bacterium]